MDYAKLLENSYKATDNLLVKLSALYSDMFSIHGDLAIVESKLRAFFQPEGEETAKLYNEILDHFDELLTEMVDILRNS